MTGPDAARPLAGLVVLEAASFIAGPFAAMMLGDLGAEVTKVEAPGRGDPYRNYGLRHGGVSAPWINVNRNKRSVQLDLKSAEGHRDFLRLVAQADVLIHNWRPATARSLGLDAETLAEVNPRLVNAAVTGYGSRGPLVNDPVFDGLIQARSGYMVASSVDGIPKASGAFVADKATAFVVTQAVLAAVVGRNLTGAGTAIEVPMLDSFSYSIFPDMCQRDTFLEFEGDYTPSSATVVSTADGFIAVAPTTGAQIRAAMEVIGRPELVESLRAIKGATELRERLMSIIAAEAIKSSTAHWIESFAARQVPAAPVLPFTDHFVDEQVLQAELYGSGEYPGAGRYRWVRYPASFGGRHVPEPRPAPQLGADDVAEVLERVRSDEEAGD